MNKRKKEKKKTTLLVVPLLDHSRQSLEQGGAVMGWAICNQFGNLVLCFHSTWRSQNLKCIHKHHFHLQFEFSNLNNSLKKKKKKKTWSIIRRKCFLLNFRGILKRPFIDFRSLHGSIISTL
jgi:hypothetical protein